MLLGRTLVCPDIIGGFSVSEFEYILFDLDGTISDSAAGITNSVKYALNKIGAPIPPYEVLKRFIGPPLTAGFMDYCGFDSEKADKAVEYYREYYRAAGIFECDVYEGVTELLESLNMANKKVVLATSKPEEFAVRILEHFGLLKYFSVVAGATFDASRNTKDKVITYALGKCGAVDKSAAVMIGDRHHDIEGAKVNEIASIGVLYGFGDRAELENAGADYIAEDTKEILKILKI